MSDMIKESCNFVHWWPNFISHHLFESASHEPCKNRDITFSISPATIVSCDHYGCWPLASWKFKYNIFYLPSDLTWPQKDTWLLNLWLFLVRHYPVYFSGHRSRGNGDITFFYFLYDLMCPRDQWIMWLCGYNLFIRSYPPVKFSIHRSRGSGNIEFFICYMLTWLRDQRVTWLCWRWSLTHQPAMYGGHKSCGSRDII